MDLENIKISCIVPVYNNSEEQIARALYSIVKSRYPVFEVVLVDDGSDADVALSVVNCFSNCFPDFRINYFKQKNMGPSSARNLGVRKASGEWLAFLDSDDALLDRGILSKVEVLLNQRYEALSAVFGSFIWEGDDEEQSFASVGRFVSPDEVGVIGKAPGGLPSYLVKKSAYLGVGGLDETMKFNEDFDLILRLIANGHHIYGIKEPGFVRFVNPESLTRSQVLRSLSGGRIFLRKAWRNDLLSKVEISRRYLLNYVLTVRALFRLLVSGTR